MGEFTNYVEYCVRKRPEGAYLQKRIWLIVGCVLLGLAILPAVIWSAAGKLYVTFVPVWMGLSGIVYWFLSRFTDIEYEYRIVQGEFQMDIIYGQRQRKQLAVVRIRDMTEIRPWEESRRAAVYGCERVLDCSISEKQPTPMRYYFLYQDENGRSSALLFEATEEALEIMKFYNRSVLTAGHAPRRFGNEEKKEG